MSPSETTVGDEDENHTITSAVAGPQQDEAMATNGDKNVTFGACPADNALGDSDRGVIIDFRQVENQVQEGLESLEFNLAVLQRSVDQAHINMRIASQEFSSLLKKVLTILFIVLTQIRRGLADSSVVKSDSTFPIVYLEQPDQ